MKLSTNSKLVTSVIFLLWLFVTPGNGLRILGLFPHYGKSHFDVFHPIMMELVNKGHEVSVLSHFPNNPPVKGYTDISLEGTLPRKNFGVKTEMFKPYFKSLQIFYYLMQAGDMTCKATYNSEAVKSLINSNQKFDVIIVEAFNADCMLGLVHHFKAPHILLSSHAIMPWVQDRFANPDNPAIIPNLFGRFSTEMTFLERLQNFMETNFLKYMYYFYSDIPTNKLLKEVFGDDIPPISEIKKEASLVLVNLHYSISGVRPQVPAVVDIGGVHVKPVKPLDKELENFINGAEHGVIYVSWGSMIQASSLPENKRDALLKAFGSLEQRVLWKWENENLPGQPENVMIRKWMPQRDVLGHKNIRIFMSHGGLLGTTEAVKSGVPMIITPMFGDQFLNSAALRDRGIALQLFYEDITTENVLNVINKALTPSFAENAKKVSQLFHDRPMPPLETAIWWIEHIGRTGGAQLRSPNRNMPLYQYLLIDVIGTLLIAVAIISYIVYKLFKRLFTKNKKVKKE